MPKDTTLVVIVNLNNPTGTVFDIKENLGIIERYTDTMFLIDEAFIEFGGKPAVDLIFKYRNVIITRTFSKAFSLAGCRVGYAIGNKELIDHLNGSNDAYPLARTAEAAAMASLEYLDKIRERVMFLRNQAGDLAKSLQNLGVKTYPTESFFFLGKVPMDADEFARALSKRNINIRPIRLEGMENKFLKFAASTSENNRIVLKAVKEILK
jgi:histidinol-phosphate aminotransferase